MERENFPEGISLVVVVLGLMLAVLILASGCLEEGDTPPTVEGLWYTARDDRHCFQIMSLQNGEYNAYEVCAGAVGYYRYGTYNVEGNIIHVEDQGGSIDLRYLIGGFGNDLKLYFDGSGPGGQNYFRCTQQEDCVEVALIASQHH